MSNSFRVLTFVFHLECVYDKILWKELQSEVPAPLLGKHDRSVLTSDPEQKVNLSVALHYMFFYHCSALII